MSEIAEKNQNHDIPGMFEGPIAPLIIRLGVPILAGTIVGILYNVVDTIFISMIDKNDATLIAGVGLVFPILFLAMSVSNGLQVGVSALVARSIGEKKRDILDKTAESGLILAVTLSIILLVFGYLFAGDIVKGLGGTGEVYRNGLDYFVYVLPTGLFLFFANILHGILQGEGRVKHVMNAMIIGTVLNIVFDPIFIFGLGMGVKGGALATSLAQFIAFGYTLSVFLRNQSDIKIHWKLSNIDTSIIKKILYVGIPQTFSMMIVAVSFMFLNRIVTDISDNALTAFTINGRIEQIIMMPIFAIGSAVVTTVGQNTGRKNFQRVKDIWKTAVLMGFAAVGAIAAIMFFLAPIIYPNFSEVQEVIDYSVTQTRFFGFFYLFAVVSMVAFNVFQAVNNPLPGFLLTLMRMLLIAFPAALFYVEVLGLGMWGVWFGLATGNVVSAILSFFITNKTLNNIQRKEEDRSDIDQGVSAEETSAIL